MVCLSTSAGHFYALRVADGKRAWDMDASVAATYKRTWAVDGGNVILGTETTSPRAYDAATGAKGVTYSTQEPYVPALSAAGGVLYAIDAFGVLYAFHTANGTEIWHKQLLSSDDLPGTGLTIDSGGAGGVLYAIDAFGVLYAFHTANGTEIWHKQLLSSDDLPGTGLTIDSGGIFVGTLSGTLYKVDATNGKVLWTYHPGSGIESNIVVADGVVYFRDNNGTLHAINAATNKQLWAKTAVATGIYGQAVTGGRVYYTISLALQALDAKSGDPVWAFTAPNNAALLGTPAVANGLVFIGSYDDGLYAIKA